VECIGTMKTSACPCAVRILRVAPFYREKRRTMFEKHQHFTFYEVIMVNGSLKHGASFW